MTANGHGLFLIGDKSVLKFYYNDGCTTSNIVKTTELCMCTLNERILWCVNYVSAKLLEKNVLLMGEKKEIGYNIGFKPVLTN